MTGYAAFLRGINLGGATRLEMADLRAIAESLGWSEVRTYINSGNVVFSSTKKAPTLAHELSAAITDTVKRSIDVAVRSRADLDEVLSHNPFPDEDPTYVTVTFAMTDFPAGSAASIAAIATDREPFEIRGREAYVHYADGQAGSKLAATFASVVGVSTTTRNLRTVGKVRDLLGS